MRCRNREGTADSNHAPTARPPQLDMGKVMWSDEYGGWEPERKMALRRELVEKYVAFAAPALAFSLTQLTLALSTFLGILTAFNVSGAGYAAVRDGVSGALPFLAGPLGGIDEGLGNAAISLLLTDVVSPLLLGGALAATPGVTAQIDGSLKNWGLDADGLNSLLDDWFEKGPASP